MHRMTREELEAQVVLELPDRHLMGALIRLSGQIQLTALEHLLNHYFNGWSELVSADYNTVTINVRDSAVTDSQLKLFCTEASSKLTLQCKASLT